MTLIIRSSTPAPGFAFVVESSGAEYLGRQTDEFAWLNYACIGDHHAVSRADFLHSRMGGTRIGLDPFGCEQRRLTERILRGEP